MTEVKKVFESRPYQNRIVTKSVDMFLGRYKNGAGELEQAKNVLIESPTGSGKTPMGLLVGKKLQEVIPELVIGWTAMRKVLLKQAVQDNEELVGVRNLIPVSMFDSDPSEILAAKRAGKPILWVNDEAQHSVAPTAIHLQNTIDADFNLGLSATPKRTDRVGLTYEKVIKDCGIHSLIQDGYLSQYHHYTIEEWTPRAVADAYLREPSRWGKVCAYFMNIDLCDEYAHYVREGGHKIEVVTGKSDSEKQLEMFSDGTINHVVNVQMLTEGFDAPDLCSVFVRDSEHALTVQMSGRVFRKHKDHAFKQVLQSAKTHWPMMRTAAPKEQYLWNVDRWLSIKVNPHVDEIADEVREAVALIQLPQNEWLHGQKGRKGWAARKVLQF